ncbi:MAG: hypothetical protein RL065_69 [Bacteroidota bacterium]
MEHKDLIKQELNQISPLLAEIGNRNGFKVPKGYFENLTENVLLKKNAASFDEAILTFPKINSFTTPENYFESTEKLIVDISKKMVDDEPILTFSKLSAFKVDEVYFENLSSHVFEKIKNSELNQELIKVESFSIPENYFETNPDKFLAAAKASEQTETKVISWFHSGYFKFSAAAAVAAFIIGITFLFQSKSTISVNQELTAQEIKCYLQTHTEDVDELQLTDKVVKANVKKTIINSIPKQNKVEIEKQELKNYLENELDETDLNDAI